MMRPMGPSPSAKGCWSMIWRSMGSKKAKVLPDPVLATPITSRPDMSAGMACRWIGNGAWQAGHIEGEEGRGERGKRERDESV